MKREARWGTNAVALLVAITAVGCGGFTFGFRQTSLRKEVAENRCWSSLECERLAAKARAQLSECVSMGETPNPCRREAEQIVTDAQFRLDEFKITQGKDACDRGDANVCSEIHRLAIEASQLDSDLARNSSKALQETLNAEPRAAPVLAANEKVDEDRERAEQARVVEAQKQQTVDAEYTTKTAGCRDGQTVETCKPLSELFQRPEFTARQPEITETLRVAYPHVLDQMTSQLVEWCKTSLEDCEGGGKQVIEGITQASDDLHFIDDAPVRIARVRKIIAQGRVAAVANAAAAKKRAGAAIPLGRRTVLQHLKAPSTARFLSDSLLYECRDGDTFITTHEVDSQNGFGAMVRESHCAVVVPKQNLSIIPNDDCSTVGSLFVSRRLEGNTGHASVDILESTCNTYVKMIAIGRRLSGQ